MGADIRNSADKPSELKTIKSKGVEKMRKFKTYTLRKWDIETKRHYDFLTYSSKLKAENSKKLLARNGLAKLNNMNIVENNVY